jgi:hypothetical protein
MSKTYNIFISHAWRYSEDYYRLVEMLKNAPYFSWKNYSVPQHDPVLDPEDEADRRKLLEELEDQIRPVHVVIVISGIYVSHRYWIQKEIEIALRYGKPIVGVKPWGQQRTPQLIQEVACELVGWNTPSIIRAVRNCSL